MCFRKSPASGQPSGDHGSAPQRQADLRPKSSRSLPPATPPACLLAAVVDDLGSAVSLYFR